MIQLDGRAARVLAVLGLPIAPVVLVVGPRWLTRWDVADRWSVDSVAAMRFNAVLLVSLLGRIGRF